MANTFDEAVDQFVDYLRVRSNSRAIYRIQAADKRVQEARADMTELVMALVEALQGLCHGDGCFCEAAFAMPDGSHPRHSDECTKARTALVPFEEGDNGL